MLKRLGKRTITIGLIVAVGAFWFTAREQHMNEIKKLENQRQIKEFSNPESIKIGPLVVKATNTKYRRSNEVGSLSKLKPGQKIAYKDFILMGLEGNHLLSDKERETIEEQWNRQVKDFIRYELGLGEIVLRQYLEAKRSSFEVYDSLIRRIDDKIFKKYGDQIQLISGNNLDKLYKTSREIYREKLKTIFGPSGYARFKELQNKYGEWIYQKFDVGWNDLR